MKQKSGSGTAGKRIKPEKILALLAIIVFLQTLFFALFDTRLTVKEYRIEDRRIKNEICFVMLSDLHRSVYGKDQSKLIETVLLQKPDAVFLCGDIFDENGEYEKTLPLLQALGTQFPCFFVSGNHEYGSRTSNAQIAVWKEILSLCGIVCLESEKQRLFFGDTVLDLFGAEDENRYLSCRPGDSAFFESSFEKDFDRLNAVVSNDVFSLLLCHRPLPSLFSSSGFDLVLSGHCHGGQWRIPGLVNGLYAPGEGFFPKYAGGLYDLDGKWLIVGRGLCKTGHLRICNRPEVVVVRLLPSQ